ncbi:hypothetical protein, conserved [Eimeria maxima]|uniref:Uncharacterized protein n=1 Tax=Eimeria maxima TaxID=5804 RepID=U6MA43_EIMMA|nr:hypothetical protein, conserved [Eimeria maxima]CDJ60916.1 hypothetical protein, conserved [Eimeria maxima]
MLSSFLSCWLPGCTPPPPPQQLRRWQLVRLPIHSSSRPKLSPGQEEAAPFRTGSLLEQPGSRSGAVSEDEGFVAVPERLTSSFSLFLINLKWHRTIINTISQAELLALCRLAKARSTIRCTEQLGPLSAAPPSKGVLMQQEWRGPCSTDSGAHCAGDRETPCSADGVSASPSHAWRDPQSERPVTASGIPLIRIVGRRKLRVDPIDVCGLLVSGCLQLADLPLLEDLEAVAEETEAAHEKENKCWKWAPLLGMGRRRGDIWKCAAANLQHQQQQKQRQQQRQGPVRRRRNKRFASEGLSSSLTVLQSPRSTAAANDLNVKTPPPPAEGASAEGTAADRPFSSTGAQLGFCGHPACTAEVSGRAPSGDPLKIHFPCGRKGATRIPLGVPDTPSALVCSEDGGEEAEITGEAAAAAVSNLSNNSLALLGHSCRWPLAGACDGWASPSCTAHMGLWEHLPGSDSPSAPVGAYPGDLPSHSEEDWKSAVGFRESRRGGSISRKRRETQRQRQRLSPLDPPYDSHALLLHPFSAAPAAALPDSETARAHEVHEVSLDFLSRTKPTQGCPKCSRRRGSKGDASEGPLTVKVPPCPLHQRLHYTQVGKGPERVVLIHGICMSGYFFAEVIRVLFPDTGEGGLPRGNRPEGPDDGDERGRGTPLAPSAMVFTSPQTSPKRERLIDSHIASPPPSYTAS